MIIAVIGEKCSGKKTFIEILKKIDPNITTVYSESSSNKTNNELSKAKENVNDKISDKIDCRLNEYVDTKLTWLENHKTIVQLLNNTNIDSDKPSNTKNSNKDNHIISTEKKDKVSIKDKVRNQQDTIVILNFTLEDFYLLQNKAPFRLVRINSNVKRRYQNYLEVNKDKLVDNSNQQNLFEDFIQEDEDYSKKFQLHSFKSTIIYNISNTKDIQTFQTNINEFWDKVKHKYRPTWDDYFMSMALHLADRSNCIKLKVGALTQKNGRIISTGFNGTPKNMINCFEGGCPRCHSNETQGKNLDSCFCIHAEENSIIEIGRDKLDGATMYVSFSPCLLCCKLIIQSGIKKVFYMYEYKSDYSMSLFKQANVEIEKYTPDKHDFDN